MYCVNDSSTSLIRSSACNGRVWRARRAAPRLVNDAFTRPATRRHKTVWSRRVTSDGRCELGFSQLQRLSTFSVIWALCIEAFKRESGVRPSVHFLHHSSSSERFGSVRYDQTPVRHRRQMSNWPTSVANKAEKVNVVDISRTKHDKSMVRPYCWT